MSRAWIQPNKECVDVGPIVDTRSAEPEPEEPAPPAPEPEPEPPPVEPEPEPEGVPA